MRSLNLPLRLLTENEIFRMSVWGNPTNDTRKGGDIVGSTERTLLEVSLCQLLGGLPFSPCSKASWPSIVRNLWHIDPAIVVHLIERFKNLAIRQEVSKLVLSNPIHVLDIPEALAFLLGDRLELRTRKNLKVGYASREQDRFTKYPQYLLLWTPVPPIIANTFFERRFNSDPLILQYAHRVLAQHPVELTFFFIPQIVQALRYDDLGKDI
jgi:phosphatidylinositol 4-kinase